MGRNEYYGCGDNSGRNIKLDQATCMDMSPLRRDSPFNVIAWGWVGVRKSSNGLLGWLAETWSTRWPTLDEVEMPELLWCTVKEGRGRSPKA